MYKLFIALFLGVFIGHLLHKPPPTAIKSIQTVQVPKSLILSNEYCDTLKVGKILGGGYHKDVYLVDGAPLILKKARYLGKSKLFTIMHECIMMNMMTAQYGKNNSLQCYGICLNINASDTHDFDSIAVMEKGEPFKMPYDQTKLDEMLERLHNTIVGTIELEDIRSDNIAMKGDNYHLIDWGEISFWRNRRLDFIKKKFYKSLNREVMLV